MQWRKTWKIPSKTFFMSPLFVPPISVSVVARKRPALCPFHFRMNDYLQHLKTLMRNLRSSVNRLQARLRALETLPIPNLRRRCQRRRLLLRVFGLKRRQLRVQKLINAQHAWETANLRRAYEMILEREALAGVFFLKSLQHLVM
jgi:hypothetical protein